MKTNISSISKRKFFLFFTTFLFLSVFFIGSNGSVNVANASCSSDCQFMATSEDGSYFDEGLYGECYSASDCYAVDQGPIFDANNSDTWTMDNFETKNPVDSGGNSSNCDPDPSCWWYNCCSSQDSTYIDSSAAIAEQKELNNKNMLAANAATAKQKNALDQYNAALASVASCGGNTTKCAEAQAAENKARQALLDANTKAEELVAAYNASNAIVNPNTASTGAGYMLCANGILATVCEGGSGSPYTVGIGGYFSGGGYSGGSGLPGSYSSGGVSSPKCGANFQDIGGVCFPMNTGLSNAPISTIIYNLFSWLMGLFTTLAVLAFVISGVQYLLVAADEDMVKTAKNNAKNAMIGIIVGLSGFIIIKAIAAALSGQSIFF